MSRNKVLDSSKRENGNLRQSECASYKQTPKSNRGRRVTEFQRTPDCFSKVAIESPLMKSKNLAASADLLNSYGKNNLSYFEGDASNRSTIRVGVRVRPFTQR